MPAAPGTLGFGGRSLVRTVSSNSESAMTGCVALEKTVALSGHLCRAGGEDYPILTQHIKDTCYQQDLSPLMLTSPPGRCCVCQVLHHNLTHFPPFSHCLPRSLEGRHCV